MWQKLSLLDPRNLPNVQDRSWASYAHLFCSQEIDDDDEVAKAQTSHLESEWARYCEVCAMLVYLHFIAPISTSGESSRSGESFRRCGFLESERP